MAFQGFMALMLEWVPNDVRSANALRFIILIILTAYFAKASRMIALTLDGHCVSGQFGRALFMRRRQAAVHHGYTIGIL